MAIPTNARLDGSGTVTTGTVLATVAMAPP